MTARLLAALKQLVNLFLVNGFAFGGNVSIIAEGVDPSNAKGAKFSISLNAPATRKSSVVCVLL
jgi:K+-transporting ATPase c subunit